MYSVPEEILEARMFPEGEKNYFWNVHEMRLSVLWNIGTLDNGLSSFHAMTFIFLPTESVHYVVEPVKSRDVVLKTILGGSILTYFTPKFHGITFVRRGNPLRVVSFNFSVFC